MTTPAAELPTNVRELWRFLRQQPSSFWLINVYLFVEYVRPQSIWPALDVLPWGLLIVLLTLGALLLEGTPPKLRTAAGPVLVIYSIVVILSSFTAIYPAVSFAQWELYFSWVLIYVLITNTVTTEKRFFVFMLAFLLYSFKMSQHGFRSWAASGFAFRNWGVTGAPGWFHNSGEFGIQMCIFLPLSVEFFLGTRQYWNRWIRWLLLAFPVTAVGSIVASSSRGALVGAGLVGCWWVARSKRRVRTIIAMVLLGAITWAVVPPEQKARFTTAGEDRTSTTRIERWEAGLKMANERPVFGIGYANWAAYYGPLSHNIFVEALAELGYTGLLAFLALITVTFVLNARTRKLARRLRSPFMMHAAYGLDGALIGFIGSGFFVTVLYYPYFWINLAMTVSLQIAAQHAHRRARAFGLPLGRTHRQPSLGIT